MTEADPFSGRVEQGRVFGRGAADTKASLAIILALLEWAQNTGRKPEPNLLIVGTVDEEVGARGAPAFANWVRKQGIALDELLVAEPTGCAPVFGHKGVCRLEFAVHGNSAHSSQPELGRNAILAAARLALDLDHEHRRMQSVPPTSALGAPTLSVTLMQGGEGINVVPARCSVSVDRRVVAGEKPADVSAGLRELAEKKCSLPVSTSVLNEIDAFLQSPESPWIRRLAEWSNLDPAIVPFGTNAWAYNGLARECVVLGPGSIDQAHGKVEWVEISQLERLAAIYSSWWGL